MEKNIHDSLLFDFYGDLLTEKQQRVLKLYLEFDDSLSEIADQLSSSRQAVYDMVRSALSQLENFESKLGCVANYLKLREVVGELIRELESVKTDEAGEKKLQNSIKMLEKLLQN